MDIKEEILHLLLKHSRNGGDYIPDYQFDNLVDDIFKYFKVRNEIAEVTDEDEQWEEQREAMFNAWKNQQL